MSARSGFLYISITCCLILALVAGLGCGESGDTEQSTVSQTTEAVSETSSSVSTEASDTTTTLMGPSGKIQMAFNTLGPKTDGSWSESFYDAFLELQEKYPDVEFSHNDLVPFNDAPSFLRQQSEDGVDIIYVESLWFDAVKAVAADCPDTWFVMPELTEDLLAGMPDNVTTYCVASEQNCFLAGVAAGMVTKSNIIGAVLGMLGNPNLNRSTYAFLEGARWVNPDIDLIVQVTGDWNDIMKGYDSAIAAIDAGADVLMHYADNAGLGVLKATSERHVWAVEKSKISII